MEDIKNSLVKDDKQSNNKEKLSFKNLKKIRKDLMSFAEDEILDIKKSNKDINIASFVHQEVIAPSKYTIISKKLNRFNSQNYDNKIVPVEEKVTTDKSNNKNNNNGEAKMIKMIKMKYLLRIFPKMMNNLK